MIQLKLTVIKEQHIGNFGKKMVVFGLTKMKKKKKQYEAIDPREINKYLV